MSPDCDLDFTIAIPTYNGARRISMVIDRLKAQVDTESITWEILVVDNNSTDETATVIQELQAIWQAPFSLRYCFEAEQGAAFARQKAVREARGRLVGFLDDDNLPAPDWLVSADRFAKEYPQAGAYGGPIHGQFETEPPPHFEKIQGFLAIRDHGPIPVRFDAENLRLPPAASLVVRRQAWLEAVPPRPKLGGKLPGLLVQGDDYEPLLYLHKAGWEIWYNPALHSYHQIPPQRFEREYLLRLARGCGLPTCQLKMIGASPVQKPGILLKSFAGSLKRAIGHWLSHRHHLETDLAAACEMAFLEASVMSVFFYLKRSLSRS